MWGKAPTASGQIVFAKGRLRKWSTSLEQGVKFSGKHGDADIVIDDPGGLTATLRTGAKVLVHRNLRVSRPYAEYTVIDAEGNLKVYGTWGITHALCSALGGDKTFEVGHSRIYMHVYHYQKRNKLMVGLNFRVPNPAAEYECGKVISEGHQTSNEDCFYLAVGILAEKGDNIWPLLDRWQEVHPGKIDKVCGYLHAEFVPDSKLKRIKHEWVDDEKHPMWQGKPQFLTRVEYLTGEPVAGPDGQWHE